MKITKIAYLRSLAPVNNFNQFVPFLILLIIIDDVFYSAFFNDFFMLLFSLKGL